MIPTACQRSPVPMLTWVGVAHWVITGRPRERGISPLRKLLVGIGRIGGRCRKPDAARRREIAEPSGVRRPPRRVADPQDHDVIPVDVATDDVLIFTQPMRGLCCPPTGHAPEASSGARLRRSWSATCGASLADAHLRPIFAVQTRGARRAGRSHGRAPRPVRKPDSRYWLRLR
jgi:hypothetical protein